jgi:hypothetical protein
MTETLNLPIRINCQDPELLLGRCMVSGIRVLDPDEAVAQGYKPHGAIVPTEPREPTEAELLRFIATPDTPPSQVMHLRRLPAYLAHYIIGQRVARPPLDEASPRIVIAPGVESMYRGVTATTGNQLSTTVDPDMLNPVTGAPSKVGMHLDAYKGEDTSALRLAGINMGPGRRYFYIAPGINRESLGGPELRTVTDQAACITRTGLHEDPAAVYWLRLDAPQLGESGDPQTYEAYTNAAVAWHSHDGSTWGLPDPSRAAFVLSRGVAALAEFPSLVG